MASPTHFKTILVLLLGPTLILGTPLPPAYQLTPSMLEKDIKRAARRAALDPALVKAVIQVESNYNSRARSHKGALGLMQVMPQTADACGIHDPFHITNHLMGATDCLRKLINRYRGNLRLALAAYNAGPTAVSRYKGIPPYPETKNYVKKVLALYRKFRKKIG